MTDDTYYYPQTMSIYRTNYKTDAEYRKAYQDCCKHYGYKIAVDGSWRFFEFGHDLNTWKNQK